MPIKGIGLHAATTFREPNFCAGCGTMFEWTKLEFETVAKLVTEDGNLEQDEMDRFEIDIQTVAKNSPAPKELERIKHAMTKMKEGTVNAIHGVIVRVASAGIVESLWP